MANFSIQIYIELRSCNLLVPWLKKASTFNFCRSYQTSGPVAYIPRNYSHWRENQCSFTMKSSKEKTIGYSLNSYDRRVNNRTSNLDKSSQNEFPCARRVTNAENVAILGNPCNLHKIQVNSRHIEELSEFEPPPIDEDQISHDNISSETEEVCTGKTKQDAENVAIEALAARAFTAVELRKKLRGKKFPLDIIEGVVADFQARGLLNDSLYAESFSRSRWLSMSWGPRRVKQALLQKGVSEAVAEKAMKQVFEDGDSDDQDSCFGLSKSSMDHLFARALKQWQRGGDTPLETRKTRIVRWLQYRGFNWRVTTYILKELESQYQP